MRKIISILIVTLSISSLAFASTFTPDIIRDYEKNGEKYLAKSYEIDMSNQYEFENGIELKLKDGLKIYELDNTSKNGGKSTLSKEESQIKVVETNSDKIEDVLLEFPSEIEYEDENGFKGTLLIDTSTVTTTEVFNGTYNKSYKVTETVEYQNLNANDLDKVPKTKVKNGITMKLTSVDWIVQSTQMIGSSQVPVSYKCVAHYSGNGVQKVQGESKYTSSATYRGIIEKEEIEPLNYELTYIEIFNGTWIVIVGTLGVILLITGLVLYRRKKNSRR